MKKRLLSLALCLVMVFSLLPIGSLAVERPVEQYVSAGTNWTTTSNYAGKAAEGNDGTLYYKDGDNYYPVTWETNKDLYTVTTQNKWKPAEINGHYYSTDELNFSAVSTKNGTMYVKSTQTNFDDSIVSEGWHTNWQYYATRFFVKNPNAVTVDGGYSRMFVVTGGEAFNFVGWFYYFKDGKYNAPGSVNVHNSNQIATQERDLGVFGIGAQDVGNINNLSQANYWRTANDRVLMSVGESTPINYKRGITGAGTISSASRITVFRDTLYTQTTDKNSIWYNNGNTQLGSTVYDADTVAYNGVLYTKTANKGTTKLTYNNGTADVSFGTATAIDGKAIYSGDLYVLKNEALPTPEPTAIIHTEEAGDDGVYTHKELDANGDAYDITLTAYTTGNEVTTSSETITPTVKPMDIVMVIDQSGSMATRDMGNVYSAAATPSGGWTMEAATGGKQYYYSPDGYSYYPVYASTGYIYEKVDGSPRASDMLNDGDDAISLGVNGAPTYYNITTDYYVMYNGELHPLRLITAGLFLQYGLYPYIYTDNNDMYASKGRWTGNNYWVAVFDPWDGSDLRDESTWNYLTNQGAASSRVSFVNTNGQAIGSSDSNADSARLSYSWFTSSDRISNLYKQSDTKVANQLYYIDSAGNRQNIGTTAQYAGDVVYTGTLYEGNSESRVDALKAAVTEFANTVQANAQNFGVDHRMALVGFAGNKVPAYSLARTPPPSAPTALRTTPTPACSSTAASKTTRRSPAMSARRISTSTGIIIRTICLSSTPTAGSVWISPPALPPARATPAPTGTRPPMRATAPR